MPVSAQLIPVGTWKADPVHSSAAFAVEHLGVSNFRASFSDFEATLVASEEAVGLEGAALVESVSVRDPQFRGHLLSPDFDAERHPEIRFESTDVRPNGDGAITVDGHLTMKGATRRMTARGRVGELGVDPYGTERIAVELEAVVDRNDFGLGWNMELPGDAVARPSSVGSCS
jgi:polyisoprenoid-binding protein YceI